MVRYYYQGSQQQINDEQLNQEVWAYLSKQIQKQDIKIFDNFRPFGYAFFTNQIQKQYNIRLFRKNLIQELSKESWFIKVKDEKEKNRLELIFSIMIESQAITIQFKSYPMPNILKTISNVGFHQLTKLNLYKMDIVNIEALSFVDAPNLKTLNFIYNQVYQFKSLKKANFQLEKLFIYIRSQTDFFKKSANFNIRIDDSSRWDFKLQELRLQKHFYNKIINEDLSFLGKLKHKSNLYLDTNLSMNTKRILQRKLFQRYFDETNIRLHLIEIYDDRQFPVNRYLTLKNFHAFHIQRQY